MLIRVLPLLFLFCLADASSGQAVRDRTKIAPDISYINLALGGQSPTVMDFLFTSVYYDLEIVDRQLSVFAEKGQEIREAFVKSLADNLDTFDENTRWRSRQLLRLYLHTLSIEAPDAHEQLAKKIYEIRKEIRSEFLPQQMDQLIGHAFREFGIGAIRFEEVSDRFDISVENREELVSEIVKAQRRFIFEATPRLPLESIPDSLAERQFRIDNGIRYRATLSEEELQIAYEKRDSKIREVVNDLLDEKQLAEIERLVKAAEDD